MIHILRIGRYHVTRLRRNCRGRTWRGCPPPIPLPPLRMKTLFLLLLGGPSRPPVGDPIRFPTGDPTQLPLTRRKSSPSLRIQLGGMQIFRIGRNCRGRAWRGSPPPFPPLPLRMKKFSLLLLGDPTKHPLTRHKSFPRLRAQLRGSQPQQHFPQQPRLVLRPLEASLVPHREP